MSEAVSTSFRHLVSRTLVLTLNVLLSLLVMPADSSVLARVLC